ncbi:enoyl-CoA hydratase [Diaminobutyricimonas sp. LJ205]|uniref:enoyl-CoA hydratase n=1 Tax=Diaminobutyricimonas sp. LJ205 TaxID=2683590 RepID=UPI0012F4A507|nr:enoyl-CoA hydratase [Diaminobutyricimonas sp. LJ205]
MTDYRTILVERQDRVGLITLHRPDALNALSQELMGEVVDAATRFDRDAGIGAIVLTGSERAFAAGADIKEMAEQGYADMHLADWFGPWDTFAAIRTPVIAAVAGHALGGGCELALMCDIVIAAETAKFGQPEVGIGVMPGMGGSQRLTRAIGQYKAMDMILTGRTMGAHEAERAGLVSRIVAADALLDEALEVASGIAAKSLPVLYSAKEAVRVASETTLAEGVRFERRAFHALFALDDQAEGMAAFREKRAPEFRGQ